MSSIYDVQIDPRNEDELLDQVTRYIFEKSNGRLSNLNPSNPLIFLLEAQIFAGAELLWYANKLPAKVLTYFLSQYQELIPPATKATGQLTLNLTSALPNSYTVNSLTVSNGTNLYSLISPVTFASGQIQATGLIEADDFGRSFNSPAFSINEIVTPTAFLASVTNLNPLSGGTDELTAEEAVESFVSDFRDSQLISAGDYEKAVRRLIGDEYAIKIRYSEGVRVLIGNPSGVSLDVLRNVQRELDAITPMTVEIIVQTLDYKPVDIFIKAEGSESLADSFYEYLQAQLLPGVQSISRDDLVKFVSLFGFRFVDGYVDLFRSSVSQEDVTEVLFVNSLNLVLNGKSIRYGESDDRD